MNISFGLSSKSEKASSEEKQYYVIAEGHASLASGSAILEKNSDKPLADLNEMLFNTIQSGDMNFILARIVQESAADTKKSQSERYYLEVFDTMGSDVFLVRQDSTTKLEYRVKDKTRKELEAEIAEKIQQRQNGCAEIAAPGNNHPEQDERKKLNYARFELKNGCKVVIVRKGMGMDEKSIKKMVGRNNAFKASSRIVEKSKMYDASAIVVGADDTTYKPNNRKSLAEKAAYAGLGLLATAALAVGGGYLLNRASNKPATHKQEIAAGLEQRTAQVLEDSTRALEDSAFSDLDSYVAGQISAMEKEKQEKSSQNAGNYTVRNGDTLWDIVAVRYSLKDDAKIADMVNKIVDLNKEKHPNLKLDTVYVDSEGAVRAGQDGIKGDVIYAGDELVLPVLHDSNEGSAPRNKNDGKGSDGGKGENKGKPGFTKTKTASAGGIETLDTLLESYSRATLQEGAYSAGEGSRKGFDDHAKEIAGYYAMHGRGETLDTYAMLNDNSKMLDDVLQYAWRELGVRRYKTEIVSLSIEDLRKIKDIYFSCTNKKALEEIGNATGLNMSEGKLYAALDKLGQIDNTRYRKINRKEKVLLS